MCKLRLLPVLTLLAPLISVSVTGAEPHTGASVPIITVPATADLTSERPDPANARLQTSEEALAQDLASVAEARGWSIEEAANDHEAAEAVGRVAAEVDAARPDIFVGSVLSKEPGGAPELYIKGPADEFVRSLVETAGIGIEIVDNQPYAFDELEERKIQVHHALEAEGFRNVSTGFDVAGRGLMIAGVTRERGLPTEAGRYIVWSPSLSEGQC